MLLASFVIAIALAFPTSEQRDLTGAASDLLSSEVNPVGAQQEADLDTAETFGYHYYVAYPRYRYGYYTYYRYPVFW